MPEGDHGLSTEALADVAYLSRSENRVAILDALATGSYSRGELAELTGASRTTLDRIVNELEDRGWAERTTDGTYEATASGAQLIRRVRPLVDSVEALRRLGDAIAWLPIEELSIGLEHFSDATVRRPIANDPVETVEFMTALLREASEFRVLTHLIPPDSLEETMQERAVAHQLDVSGVVTDEPIEYLEARPDRADRWRTLLEAGATVHRHPGPLPCNLWVFDETVLIKQSGPDPIDESYGVPIVSENETVRSWAHDLIDQYRSEATRVDASAFVDGVSEPAP
jgi:predicted transcriptional regulator